MTHTHTHTHTHTLSSVWLVLCYARYDTGHYIQSINSPLPDAYVGVRMQRLDQWLCVNANRGFQCRLFLADVESAFLGHQNRQLCPADDLLRYLRYGYAADRSVLVLTFDLRSGEWGQRTQKRSALRSARHAHLNLSARCLNTKACPGCCRCCCCCCRISDTRGCGGVRRVRIGEMRHGGSVQPSLALWARLPALRADSDRIIKRRILKRASESSVLYPPAAHQLLATISHDRRL